MRIVCISALKILLRIFTSEDGFRLFTVRHWTALFPMVSGEFIAARRYLFKAPPPHLCSQRLKQKHHPDRLSSAFAGFLPI